MSPSQSVRLPPLAAAVLLLVSRAGSAQDSDGTEQLRRLLSQSLASASLLASDDFASSGRFRGTEDDSTRLRVRGLGGRHVFNEEGRWRPHLGGSAAEVVVESEPLLIGEVRDERRYEVRGLALEGGLTYVHHTGWFTGLGLELDYSWIENRYRYTSEDSRALAPLIDGIIVNWDAEVLTVQTTASVGWQRDAHLSRSADDPERKARLGAQIAASWVGLRSDPTAVEHPLQNATVESEYLRLQASLTVPLPRHFAGEPLALSAGWRESFLSSEISESLDTDTLSDVQLSFSAATPARLRNLLPIDRLGLRASYIFADSFDGWSFGVTFAE